MLTFWEERPGGSATLPVCTKPESNTDHQGPGKEGGREGGK